MPQTGKHSGKRLQGSVYRSIVRLAANGDTVNQIARQAKVSWITAKAVIEHEAKSISERKQILADASMRVASHALERLEDNLHNLPLSQLTTIYGVATDKIVALTSTPEQQNQQHLHLHLQPIDLIGQFNNLLGKLKDEQSNEQRPVTIDSDMRLVEQSNVNSDMRRVAPTKSDTMANKPEQTHAQDDHKPAQ